MSSYQPGNTEGRTEEQVHVQPAVWVALGSSREQSGKLEHEESRDFPQGTVRFLFQEDQTAGRKKILWGRPDCGQRDKSTDRRDPKAEMLSLGVGMCVVSES